MTTYASDTFNRGDNAFTLGAADGPGTPTWTAAAATWGIAGNRAYVASAVNNAVAHLAIGQSAVHISADLTLSSTSNRVHAGFAIRYSDTNNHVRVIINKAASVDTTSAIIVDQVRSGAITNLFTVNSAGLTEGTTYALKAIVTGLTVGVWINGVERISPVSFNAALTDQNYGMYARVDATNDDGGSRWDNFLVTDGVPATVAHPFRRSRRS